MHCAESYDVCVIGAGINGSATAYNLGKRGKKVILLEQFPVPHTQGSSHGQSRIFRVQSSEFIESITSKDSIPLWRQLEKETGETLFITNNFVTFYDKAINDGYDENWRHGLDSLDEKYRLISNDEIKKEYPLFNIPSGFEALYEFNGGTLLASKCLKAYQTILKHINVLFRDSEKVTDIILDDIITIKTNKSFYKANSIVVTAGSYTKFLAEKLGLNLPLEIQRVYPAYWKLLDTSMGTMESGCPNFMVAFGDYFIYGLPAYEYPGLMKICFHEGVATDIDHLYVKANIEPVKQFISKYMKKVETEPSIIEECLYTVTPDKVAIVDKHPLYKNVIIGAGFSGHGFKMAPITGQILADLALDIQPSYDISAYSINRFPNIMQRKSVL